MCDDICPNRMKLYENHFCPNDMKCESDLILTKQKKKWTLDCVWWHVFQSLGLLSCFPSPSPLCIPVKLSFYILVLNISPISHQTYMKPIYCQIKSSFVPSGGLYVTTSDAQASYFLIIVFSLRLSHIVALTNTKNLLHHCSELLQHRRCSSGYSQACTQLTHKQSMKLRLVTIYKGINVLWQIVHTSQVLCWPAIRL